MEEIKEVTYNLPLPKTPSVEEAQRLYEEEKKMVGRNPRSKSIKDYIDCDVYIDGKWYAYTTTPTDTISRGLYFEMLGTKETRIAPNIYHDWIDGEWVPFSAERLESYHAFERNYRIKEAERLMEPLMLAEKLGDTTKEEADKLLKLRRYVLSLHRMDLTKIEPAWPEME